RHLRRQIDQDVVIIKPCGPEQTLHVLLPDLFPDFRIGGAHQDLHLGMGFHHGDAANVVVIQLLQHGGQIVKGTVVFHYQVGFHPSVLQVEIDQKHTGGGLQHQGLGQRGSKQAAATAPIAAGKGDQLCASEGEFSCGSPTSTTELQVLQPTAQHIFQSVDLLRQKQEIEGAGPVHIPSADGIVALSKIDDQCVGNFPLDDGNQGNA